MDGVVLDGIWLPSRKQTSFSLRMEANTWSSSNWRLMGVVNSWIKGMIIGKEEEESAKDEEEEEEKATMIQEKKKVHATMLIRGEGMRKQR